MPRRRDFPAVCSRSTFHELEQWTARHTRKESPQSDKGVINEITDLEMKLDKENFSMNSTHMVCIDATETMGKAGKPHHHIRFAS
jgi:hypothetical protein